MVISWLSTACTIVFRSVLLVSRLQVDVIIYLSPLSKLRPDTVDPGVRVQANRAVRLDPLARNDLVRTNSDIPVRRDAGDETFEYSGRDAEGTADGGKWPTSGTLLG